MVRRLVCLGSIIPLAALFAWPASAADMASASYTLRGAHVSAGSSLAASASFYATSAFGQSEPVGPSGSPIDLGTLAPGFMPILVGGFAHLDGDGVAYFLDDDDDGDGLDDVVETNLGAFVSASDTGTDSLLADTDGDGVDDGVEVGAGSDPNDPESTPGSPPVPAFGPLTRWAPALALGLATLLALRPRSPARS